MLGLGWKEFGGVRGARGVNAGPVTHILVEIFEKECQKLSY